MKVYVDELSERCDECPYYYRDESEYDGCYECCSWCGYEFSKETCPLQSLADHDKQVRKEVVQEIKNKIETTPCLQYELMVKHKNEINDILDQIQGETNVKD